MHGAVQPAAPRAALAAAHVPLFSLPQQQVELRVLAHLSGDSQLVQLLQRAGAGGDAFAAIASTWLGSGERAPPTRLLGASAGATDVERQPAGVWASWQHVSLAGYASGGCLPSRLCTMCAPCAGDPAQVGPAEREKAKRVTYG